MLGLIEEKIKNKEVINDKETIKDIVIVISLNAWMFEGYDDAKTEIMGSLLKAIEKMNIGNIGQELLTYKHILGYFFIFLKKVR
ncbi:hypothetical protein P5F67_09775 [Clostridium perfringens]|uniref:hypothetical protein n=1 Tax=Clostridium perfringens TaxID=1502 RepID=UPI00115A4FED|nr:hypothetical protein [Clostridium perfringens]MDB2042776.1 hypothetical protein [Clostridium perfringens]MDB2055265.1 hypothetical protein [Clostridium perfringens]MDK0647870.1 hypothetical protein [Clostridium perfringens]MDK0974212.1 hypothetical protein [Clostridium perfringens]MDM0888666.1 hypothetical protein [Clostridium perfringens]